MPRPGGGAPDRKPGEGLRPSSDLPLPPGALRFTGGFLRDTSCEYVHETETVGTIYGAIHAFCKPFKTPPFRTC